MPSYYSRSYPTGDGVTATFAVPFPYLDAANVTAAVNGVPATIIAWPSPSQVTLSAAPANGAVIEIKRTTSRSSVVVSWPTPSTFKASDLNKIAKQLFYLSQEVLDEASFGLRYSAFDGLFDALTKRIKNVGDPANGKDAANKDYVDTSVSAEAAARAAADTAETNARIAAVDAEAAARSAALGVETAARTAQDNFLVSYVDTERADRIAAVGVETTARVAQDNIIVATTSGHETRIHDVEQGLLQASATNNSQSATIASLVIGGSGASVSTAVSHKAYPTAAGSALLSEILDDSAINLRGLLVVGAGASNVQAAANTAVINAATAEAKARGNGVPVILPPGIIVCDKDILIRDNAPLIGRYGYTTLRLRSAVGNANFLRSENYTDKTLPTKNVHLEGFVVDVNGAAQTGGASVRAIGVAYADHAIFRRLGIKNVVDMGLWFIPDMTSLGTSGAYGGLPNPPNRPAGDPWVSGDVLIEQCDFDASNATSTATDFIIPVSIQRLTVRDNTFRGGYRNTFGPEWVRELNMRNNKFYNVSSGIYAETIWHADIESTYVEGIHALNQADWNSALHNTAIWLATGDDTLGSTTVNDYFGSRSAKVRGNEIYNFSRPAPTAGNTTAGGTRGILISGRNSSLPGNEIVVSDNLLNGVEGLGYQAGLGGATAFGVGIQVSGATQGVQVDNNRIRGVDVGLMVGGAYPDNAPTLGTITPSNDLTDDVALRGNTIRDYKVGIKARGNIVNSRWEKNRLIAQRAGGTTVDETGILGGSTYTGGAGNQYVGG
jgi:hypothetical protein